MTVRFLRSSLLLVLVVLATAATSSSAGVTGPAGLHGFLLRADEPLTTSFTRTPSFAMRPVTRARTYQFQLSTSNTFRDNGVLYNNASLTTPVAAPTLTLPWITGTPHALYARVRADLGSTTTPWSAPFGFDVTPPTAPEPMSSYPGLLRWTPTSGADAYEVWFVDIGKFETVRSNVLDEREFYTLHQALNWIGTVRWRVRALRGDQFKQRINGIPVSMHGPWSPVYSSTNPAMTAGPIQLVGSVSDVFSDGSASSPAHKMMPAFVWNGNQSLTGASSELYRVEIFTDSQCLNRVYTSAVVGSPAWAPRLRGTLALPTDAASLTAARNVYLGDGSEASSYTFDGSQLTPAEQLAQATPTATVPGDVPTAPGTTPPDTTTAPSSSGGATGGTSTITVSGNLGPPVSLWDVDWPRAGYYWTVLPVVAVGASGGGTTVAAPGVAKGATLIPVLSTTGLRIGDAVTVGTAPNADNATIASIGPGTITLSLATTFAHPPGDTIVRSGGSVSYVDAELAEDACAAGRVQRLGISSEPSLTSAQAPFVTGLSSTGRLMSATRSSTFYGAPLIAWTPAYNADIYEVQYSKTLYPFKPELDPRSSAKGFLTFSTSDILPLSSGTWWYRVRGIDYNLPTGVQQMGWSTPQKLVVSKPSFKIVAATSKGTFKVVGGTTKTRRMTITVKSVSAGSDVTDNPPKGLDKGDKVVLTDKLANVAFQFGQNAGATVGSDSWTLTFTGPNAAVISGQAVLPGGTISVSGKVTITSAGTTAPIVGGTGAFAKARGVMFQGRSNGVLVDRFTLNLPTS
jgi:hypothetical protein